MRGYRSRSRELGLEGKEMILASRADVQWYYAAADVYVRPSLEDTFAQPPAEAMACGLSVITTAINADSRNHGRWRRRINSAGPDDVTGLPNAFDGSTTIPTKGKPGCESRDNRRRICFGPE